MAKWKVQFYNQMYHVVDDTGRAIAAINPQNESIAKQHAQAVAISRLPEISDALSDMILHIERNFGTNSNIKLEIQNAKQLLDFTNQ